MPRNFDFSKVSPDTDSTEPESSASCSNDCSCPGGCGRTEPGSTDSSSPFQWKHDQQPAEDSSEPNPAS